jgi:predicted Zn-dependent protease
MNKRLIQILRFFTTAVLLFHVLFPPYAAAMTIKEEEALSKEFLRMLSDRFQPVRDPAVAGYVSAVGRRILKEIDNPPFSFRFYVLDEPADNAFAAPAGQIFIFRGLFDLMETEADLAGILAHEIAHVTCRHISRNVERAKTINLLAMAGMIAGAFLGAGGAAKVGQAMTVGSAAAGQSMALAYSREDEMQADQLGVRYLTGAGYHPAGLMKTLKRLRDNRWFGPDEIPTYLMTHPAVEERIAFLGTWIEANDIAVEKTPEDNAAFRFVKTRLAARQDPAGNTRDGFAGALEKNPDDPLAHMGMGLLLERSGDYPAAARHIAAALEKQVFNPHLLADLGRIQFRGGRLQDALTTLKGAVTVAPDHPESLFYLGRAELEAKNPEQAAGRLRRLIRKHPGYNKKAHYFLSAALGKLGVNAEAHYHLGRYHRLAGNLESARHHLRLAKETAADDTLTGDIENELSALRKEMKIRRVEDADNRKGRWFR